jgi:hypothetical protein
MIIFTLLFFISLFEFFAFTYVYTERYKAGYKDGVEQMVNTIDSAFVRQNKIKQ